MENTITSLYREYTSTENKSGLIYDNVQVLPKKGVAIASINQEDFNNYLHEMEDFAKCLSIIVCFLFLCGVFKLSSHFYHQIDTITDLALRLVIITFYWASILCVVLSGVGAVIAVFRLPLAIARQLRHRGKRQFYKDCISAIENKHREIEDDIITMTNKYCVDTFGKKNAALIAAGSFDIGMSEDALILSLGDPDDTKSIKFKSKTRKRLFYGATKNRLGNIKYKKEIVIEDGKVVSWKDL